MKKTKLQPEPEKRKFKKEDIIGFIFGISLAWAIGLGGFIPYILGVILGVWFTGKMLNSEKKYFKTIFWVLFVVVLLLGFLSRDMRLNSEYSHPNEKDDSESKTMIIHADQVTIPGFTKYSGQEANFSFSILFPSNDPEVYDLNLGINVGITKGYQTHDIINLEEAKFVQYSLFFFIPSQGKKILSEEAIKAYLINYPKSKRVPFNGAFIKEEMTTFKGLTAIEYEFSSEMYEVKTIHKGISFVIGGIPIDLSVIYTDVTPESRIYYNEYIKSFAISRD